MGVQCVRSDAADFRALRLAPPPAAVRSPPSRAPSAPPVLRWTLEPSVTRGIEVKGRRCRKMRIRRLAFLHGRPELNPHASALDPRRTKPHMWWCGIAPALSCHEQAPRAAEGVARAFARTRIVNVSIFDQPASCA